MTKSIRRWSAWNFANLTYTQAAIARALEFSMELSPDTRPKCCEDGCEERALDGNRRCHAHYVDAVL